MSWSISVIGQPANIVTALEKYGASLSGNSKVEFDAALPSLKALVMQNFVDGKTYTVTPMLSLVAQGSGTTTGTGVEAQRECAVDLKRFYGNLV